MGSVVAASGSQEDGASLANPLPELLPLTMSSSHVVSSVFSKGAAVPVERTPSQDREYFRRRFTN